KSKKNASEKNGSYYGFSYDKLFCIFMIGCFLGVVFESIYFLFAHHEFKIRASVIYGPFNLVYGLGALLMTVSLYWLRNRNVFLIFIGSTVIGGAFEYLCSLLQELVFGTVSWDYSDKLISLNGRTSLLHSLVWGVLGLVWIKWVYPWLSSLISRVPHKFLRIISVFMSIFMSINIFLSFSAVRRQSERREGIPAANEFDRFFDRHYSDEYLDDVYLSTIVIEREN
ncbi:MAG: putative ABC transporter permease, partial [Eubacteriales bacterium]|nr:putative ABC transporter permease [Eubacteriales bacterium]